MPMVRVVVVEDSVLQRTHLVQLLEAGGDITVVAAVGTVDEAVDAVRDARPDVVTMDLEIPGGRPGEPGGVAAIERITAEIAVPILVLSAHASTAADTLAIDALAAGAVDVFPKNAAWDPESTGALRRRIHVVSRVAMVRRRPPVAPAAPRGVGGGAAPVVGIVASTGGPSALREVVGGLAGVDAPILVVQHIHPEFAASFAGWLGQVTGMEAALARDGERPQPGRVYVAPPETHLRLAAGGGLALRPEPADVLSRPSGDELLASLAQHAGASAVGAVLTGMGDDGAKGLLAIRKAGGATVAQDAASAVVDGMPKVARETGAAAAVLPVEEIAREIVAQVGARVRR